MSNRIFLTVTYQGYSCAGSGSGKVPGFGASLKLKTNAIFFGLFQISTNVRGRLQTTAIPMPIVRTPKELTHARVKLVLPETGSLAQVCHWASIQCFAVINPLFNQCCSTTTKSRCLFELNVCVHLLILWRWWFAFCSCFRSFFLFVLLFILWRWWFAFC